MARLLIIDSSFEVTLTAQRILGKSGHSYVVQGCEDPKSAISLVKESAPDLILLDLDTSTIADLKRMLYAPETASIPVIVTATDGNNEGRITCIMALWCGARDYVLKPINENVLIQRVQTQMKLS